VHELSLCGAIGDIVTRRAADRKVEIVHVQVGQLRQVVPDTLIFCWSLVTADTALDGSVLEVERIDAALKCHACGTEQGLGETMVFACQGCGGLELEVIAGEEFLVTTLELADAAT
jgi:hydrogenase nickel incorporation protein HypA/HybF